MSKASDPTPIATSILVIDDDPTMLNLARFFLEERGYDVTTVATSEDALRLIQQKPYALALTDFQLPDLDGLELVKRIKATSPDIEIIMITGYGSIGRAVEATKAGAFYFAEKPVDFDQLLPLIEKAVEGRQNKLELESLRKKMRFDKGYQGIIGSSLVMERIYEVVESIAESDANVLIKQQAAGIYSWLPLGFKVLRRIEQIVHEEQVRAGHIPLLMPTLQPADLWRESGRYDDYGQEMLRIRDRQDREMLHARPTRRCP